MLEIGLAFAGQTVSMSVGQVIELRLEENPTTGFRWQMGRNGEPACRIKEDFMEAAVSIKPPPPGQGATHVWRIEGAQVGTCEVALMYVRPWEIDHPPAKTFEVRISVTQ